MPEADYIDDGDDMLDEAVIRGLERLHSDEDADAKAELPMPPSEANDGEVQVTGRLRKVRIGVAKHYGPGPHPSGSPQQAHAGDEVETVTQDEFQATLERSRRARELFRKLEPDMNPRRSKTFQNFIAANVARLLDTDAEMNMEIIDEIANHRGLVIRTKDGNSLDIQMGLSQSFSRYGENEIVMSWIAADQKGTGLGTAFMKSMWQYSKKTGTPFRVIEVTNDAFYQKFSWLETIQTQATSAAGEYLYDPKKDAVERVDEDDPEEYDLTESPHHPDGKRWPPKMVERHYGPGPHPGTGTPQDVHSGDGQSLASIAEENLKGLIASPVEIVNFPSEEFFIGKSGEIYLGTEPWMAHGDIAEIALENIKGKVAKFVRDQAKEHGEDDLITSPVTMLMRLGFVRGYGKGDSWAFDMAQKPSRSQIKTIGDIGEVADPGADLWWTLKLPGQDEEEGFGGFPDLMRRIGVYRHMGPGDHPSGSPQQAHAGNGSRAVERYPSDADTSELFRREKELQADGQFALFTRDPETGDFLIIKDREKAIEHVGNNIRFDSRETVYAFDETRMFLRSEGEKHRVLMDAEDLDTLRTVGEATHEDGGRMIMIHNHPEHEGQFMPPSPTDLQTAAAVHAHEMRIYTGDGNYIVRVDRWDNKAAFRINKAINDYNDENYRDWWPDIYHLSPDQQKAAIRNRGETDRLKEYALERLDAVSEQFDWLSYEFEPIDDE